MDKNQNTQQFQQFLPFYVNGKLNDRDLSWMNQYLAEHPNAATQVSIEHALKKTLQSELPDFAPDQGLSAFMNRVRSEADTANSGALPTPFNAFMQRCLESISSVFHHPQWAMAVSLIIVQTGLIGILLTHRTSPLLSTQSEWRSVGGASQYQGPVLQITFKPSAKEEEIRLLLIEIHGALVGGPGQLGNYLVKVPDERVLEGKNQVMRSPIIESVNILQELPIER